MNDFTVFGEMVMEVFASNDGAGGGRCCGAGMHFVGVKATAVAFCCWCTSPCGITAPESLPLVVRVTAAPSRGGTQGIGFGCVEGAGMLCSRPPPPPAGAHAGAVIPMPTTAAGEMAPPSGPPQGHRSIGRGGGGVGA